MPHYAWLTKAIRACIIVIAGVYLLTRMINRCSFPFRNRGFRRIKRMPGWRRRSKDLTSLEPPKYPGQDALRLSIWWKVDSSAAIRRVLFASRDSTLANPQTQPPYPKLILNVRSVREPSLTIRPIRSVSRLTKTTFRSADTTFYPIPQQNEHDTTIPIIQITRTTQIQLVFHGILQMPMTQLKGKLITWVTSLHYIWFRRRSNYNTRIRQRIQ